jgi:hypothetical protein
MKSAHNTRTCTVPGRKPGTSTKVTMGMLKASRKRTKRAALMEESMSRQPARCEGLLATTCNRARVCEGEW